MNKSLVSIATLAVAGVASAQSSVTLFGVVDTAISNYSNNSIDRQPTRLNQGSVNVSRTALTTSGYNASRLGLRGTEDLGGGLAASFWLEGSMNSDDGTAAAGGFAFNRRSTVGISGGFGEVRLGRDYTPTGSADTAFDPFGAIGSGANLIFSASILNIAGGGGGFGGNQNIVRASNSLSYVLPSNLGGFYGQLMYSFHENSPGSAGLYAGGRFGYAKGPLNIAVAYGRSTTADNFSAGTTDYVKTFNLGASYDLELIKLFGELSHVKSERVYEALAFGSVDDDITGYLVGVTVPVGPGLIRAAYSRVKYGLNLTPVRFAPALAEPKASKLALGYVHNLSKRTALYATIARVSNSNGAALATGGPAFTSNVRFVPKNSTGYDFGIRHAF